MRRRLICPLLIVVASINVAVSQESSRLADQPVFVARFHGLSQGRVKEYLQRLNEDLHVGSNILAAMQRPEATETASSLDAPASGMLVYLAQGLIPSAEQIQYSEVADENEFLKLVQAQKRQHNGSAELDGSDGKFKLAVTRIHRIDVTTPAIMNDENDEGEGPVVKASAIESEQVESQQTEPKQVTVKIGIGTGGVIATSTTIHGDVVQEGDRRYMDQTTHETTWFRYHDGFMFTSQSDALWEMSLPSADSLRKENESELNGQLSFYPDRIPMGFRHLAWNAINTVSGTELQQQDDESDTDYAMRRTSGDAGLALIQACIFDTQEISGSMRLATDSQPIRGELKIEARKNSDLGKSLRDLGSARSRFAPLLNDEAAATLHFAVNLTDDWKKAAEAIRTGYTDDPVDEDDDASTALLDVYRSVLSTADHGTLESVLKVGWTSESGSVIYGGLHVDENPNLLKSLHTVMSSGASPDESCELVQKGDLQLLQVLVPADSIPEFLRLTHFYIAHSDSCLWFAMGGENAHEILRQSIARINESGGKMQAPLLTAKVDLQRWMAYPQDDATGLALLPQLYCQAVDSLVNDFVPGQSDEESPRESEISFRALQLSGSRDISVVVEADQSGMLIRCEVGSAIARSWIASALSVLDFSPGIVDSKNAEEQQ